MDVLPQQDCIADQAFDTLTLIAMDGIEIQTSPASDTIKFLNSGVRITQVGQLFTIQLYTKVTAASAEQNNDSATFPAVKVQFGPSTARVTKFMPADDSVSGRRLCSCTCTCTCPCPCPGDCHNDGSACICF
jgi:hypothetical protein